MNSQERLITALNHYEPNRVPVDFGSMAGTSSGTFSPSGESAKE